MKELEINSVSTTAKQEHKKWENRKMGRTEISCNNSFTQAGRIKFGLVILLLLSLAISIIICVRSLTYFQERQLLTKTFKQAYSERKPERRLMFHSDRGTQYMSYTFVHLLEDFGVKQSFSRTARPHDNAVRRSVFLNPQKRRTISAALYFRSGSDKRYSSVY